MTVMKMGMRKRRTSGPMYDYCFMFLEVTSGLIVVCGTQLEPCVIYDAKIR
jgi:hypothetical protein